MIEEYIILTLFIILVVCIAAGVCCYFHYKRVSKVFSDQITDYPKSMVGISESKVIELPVRKEKQPLYVFENGTKKEFKMKK